MKINGNLWIEGENGFMLGKGKAALLEAIHEQGSLAKAAELMGLSYRKAWGMIKQMNDTHSHPLVRTQPGGSQGGHTQLTAEGLSVLAQFKKAFVQHQEFLSRYNSANHGKP